MLVKKLCSCKQDVRQTIKTITIQLRIFLSSGVNSFQDLLTFALTQFALITIQLNIFLSSGVNSFQDVLTFVLIQSAFIAVAYHYH